MQVQKFHEVRMSWLINSIKGSEEVPVACAIYNPNNELVALEFNSIEKNKDSTSHAEISAIKTASKLNFHPNLDGYSLYVNLEPCLMCLGAINNSNIKKIVFGAYSNLNHENSSYLDLFRELNPNVEIIGGVLEQECQDLISSWFKTIR
jgi:tRNA(adenine34) deaminase